MLYFIDFDGVLCDSINECFVSSWLAWRKVSGDTHNAVDIDQHMQFRRLRPFIRRGADYVLIQKLLGENKSIVAKIRNQEDFDHFLKQAGDLQMDQYHEIFYQVRDEILIQNRQWWLSLNPLYPGLKKRLSDMVQKKNFYILSTKKASFIEEILRYNGMEPVSENIICTGKEKKILFIENIIQNQPQFAEPGEYGALFVDDQIDHLLAAAGSSAADKLRMYLARWGYIMPDWQNRTAALSIEEFAGLLR